MKIIVLENYMTGGMTLREACETLGVHRTTFWRLLKRFREGGEAALTHRLRGRRSNRAKRDSFKEAVCSLYLNEYKPRGYSIHAFYKEVAPRLPDYACYATVLTWLQSSQKREQPSQIEETIPSK